MFFITGNEDHEKDLIRAKQMGILWLLVRYTDLIYEAKTDKFV